MAKNLREDIAKQARANGVESIKGVHLSDRPSREKIKIAERIRITILRKTHPESVIPMEWDYETRAREASFNYAAYQIMTPSQILACEEYHFNKLHTEMEKMLDYLNKTENMIGPTLEQIRFRAVA